MRGVSDYGVWDEVVVLRMLNGTYVRRGTNREDAPERAEAVRRLVRAGLSDGQVAARLGITRRTAQRIRRRRGIPANFPGRGANQYAWEYLPLPAQRVA